MPSHLNAQLTFGLDPLCWSRPDQSGLLCSTCGGCLQGDMSLVGRIWQAYALRLLAGMASRLGQVNRAAEVVEGIALIGQPLSGWEHTEVPLGP